MSAHEANDTQAIRQILQPLASKELVFCRPDNGGTICPSLLSSTLKELKDSKLGLILNQLRKHEDAVVSQYAKASILSWKKQVAAAKKKNTSVGNDGQNNSTCGNVDGDVRGNSDEGKRDMDISRSTTASDDRAHGGPGDNTAEQNTVGSKSDMGTETLSDATDKESKKSKKKNKNKNKKKEASQTKKRAEDNKSVGTMGTEDKTGNTAPSPTTGKVRFDITNGTCKNSSKDKQIQEQKPKKKKRCPFDYLVCIDFEATCDDIAFNDLDYHHTQQQQQQEKENEEEDSGHLTIKRSTLLSPSSLSSLYTPGCLKRGRVQNHEQEIIEFPWVSTVYVPIRPSIHPHPHTFIQTRLLTIVQTRRYIPSNIYVDHVPR